MLVHFRWSFEGAILVDIRSWKGPILVHIRSCKGGWHVTVGGIYLLCSVVCSSLCFYEVAHWFVTGAIMVPSKHELGLLGLTNKTSCPGYSLGKGQALSL